MLINGYSFPVVLHVHAHTLSWEKKCSCSYSNKSECHTKEVMYVALFKTC